MRRRSSSTERTWSAVITIPSPASASTRPSAATPSASRTEATRITARRPSRSRTSPASSVALTSCDDTAFGPRYPRDMRLSFVCALGVLLAAGCGGGDHTDAGASDLGGTDAPSTDAPGADAPCTVVPSLASSPGTLVVVLDRSASMGMGPKWGASQTSVVAALDGDAFD